MHYLVLGLLYILSGFFMKLSDDAYDMNDNLVLAIVFGILCALASGIATVFNADAAYVFIGILIGNLLAFKIDGIHHTITLVIFILICLICGIPHLSLIILLITILSALGDEIGHELIYNITDNKFLILFFEYRFLMKVVIFLLALCGVLSFWTFVLFILFELSYVAADLVLKKD